MGTGPAAAASAEVIFRGSVMSRVSGDVAAKDISNVANTSSASRIRMLTSGQILRQISSQ
jgi:hypothetical protein